jgi:predicted NUDIX family phosphoesterase
MTTDLPRKYAEESLLVVPYEAVDTLLPGVGIWPTSEALLRLISTPSTMRRADAELTTEVTQLIAYYVVRHGDRILTHRRTRRQPEKRLTAVKAVGLSGHMTVSDLPALTTRDLFHQGAASGYANRELAEEISVRISSEHPITLRCCIWEPVDDFGKQHLGLVYVVPAEEEIKVLEPGLIADATFECIPNIRAAYSAFTSWSRLLLESQYFVDILSHKGWP